MEHLNELHRGLTAMELADAFLEFSATRDQEEIEQTQQAVLMAGELISELAGPLQWEGFDAAEFFQRIDFLPPQEQERIALTLMGFFGWMGLVMLMDPGIAGKLLASIAGQVSSSVCNGFLRSSCRQLVEVDDLRTRFLQ